MFNLENWFDEDKRKVLPMWLGYEKKWWFRNGLINAVLENWYHFQWLGLWLVQN